MKNKLFIISLFLISYGLCKAQDQSKPSSFTKGLEIGLGYTSNGMGLLDFTWFGDNDNIYKFDMGCSLPTGTKGEQYKTINWDELSSDVKSEGTYYVPVNIGYGKQFGKFYAVGLIGVAIGVKYRNCYDNYHILGDNGSYYKTTDGDVLPNIGAEFGAVLKNITLGVNYTIQTGVGAKIGYIFSF